MTIKNLFQWTSMKHGRERMRYRLETEYEFFGDDISENETALDTIVVLEAPAYYLEEAEVLELAEAIKARMRTNAAG